MKSVLVFLAILTMTTTASAGEEILKLDRAKEFYRLRYAGAAMHKAFAQSPEGGWGWATGKKSAQAAIEQALQTCRKHVTPDEHDCVLINIDGQWL